MPDLNTWRTVSHLRRRHRRRVQPGPDRPEQLRLHPRRDGRGRERTPRRSSTARRVRLNITPSSSYTIWFTAGQPDQRARPQLGRPRPATSSPRSRAPATPPRSTTTATGGTRSGRSRSCSTPTPAGDADYLENVYYLATYMIAAGGYGNYPFHFINGVFRATEDQTKWSNAYWYWNQRDVYNSFLASNHVDLMAGVQQALQPQLQRAEVVHADPVRHRRPLGAGDDGLGRQRARHGQQRLHQEHLLHRHRGRLQHVPAVPVHQRRRPTCGTPRTRTCGRRCKFYQAKLSRDGTGKYYMANSNAHETYWNVPQRDHRPGRGAAAVPADDPGQPAARPGRRPAGAVAEHPGQPGAVPDRATARTCRTTRRSSQTRNGENVASELIWPYDLTGIGDPDYQTALNTWNVRPFPYGNVWANDASRRPGSASATRRSRA